jgi:hypothetical protein
MDLENGVGEMNGITGCAATHIIKEIQGHIYKESKALVLGLRFNLFIVK